MISISYTSQKRCKVERVRERLPDSILQIAGRERPTLSATSVANKF